MKIAFSTYTISLIGMMKQGKSNTCRFANKSWPRRSGGGVSAAHKKKHTHCNNDRVETRVS